MLALRPIKAAVMLVVVGGVTFWHPAPAAAQVSEFLNRSKPVVKPKRESASEWAFIALKTRVRLKAFPRRPTLGDVLRTLYDTGNAKGGDAPFIVGDIYTPRPAVADGELPPPYDTPIR